MSYDSYDPEALDALALAVGPVPEWQRYAACRGADPELFFPPRRGSAAAAKRICARCPVAEQCAEFVATLPRSRMPGVWGGLTQHERQDARRDGSRAA